MPLRIAAPGDAPALLSIYTPYVTGRCYTFETEPPTVEEFRERMRGIQRFFPYLVLEEDGQLLGYAYAHFFHERRAFQWLCETTIYVRRDCHRNGCATRLYNALLPLLAAQGFCDAVAVLGCPNEPSERFHERMGFSLAMTYPQAGYKQGAWHDVKYYVKQLTARQPRPADPVPFSSLGKQWQDVQKLSARPE